MTTTKRPLVEINTRYEADHVDAINALSRETRVPKAEIYRIAVAQYLAGIERQRRRLVKLMAIASSIETLEARPVGLLMNNDDEDE